MADILTTPTSIQSGSSLLLRPMGLVHSFSHDVRSRKDHTSNEDGHRPDQLKRAKTEYLEDLEIEKQAMRIDETVDAIMNVLKSFSLQQQGNDVFLGKRIFSACVRHHVAAGRKIPMVLPAFPAKSLNTEEKVLGSMPDLGEQLALDRLNDLCVHISQVYEHGAMIVIATDGACYNDLIGITDENLWEYGATLRKMAADKGYRCIEFARIMNLLGLHNDTLISKESFVGLLDPSRKALMARYRKPNFDVSDCIKNDPDYKMTYGGYAKFLRKDLAFGPVKKTATSGKQWKARVHETAKAMIERGVAFTALIKDKFPEHVRLSIHPSSGLTKISMPLIPQPDSISMTPWHCAVAVDVYGNFRTAHAEDLRKDHDVVYKSGRPYCFRERSPLFSWDAKVEFDHLYGRGLLVRNAGGSDQTAESLSDADREKLVTLTTMQGKIVMEGF